jgi:putative acetyltransferase
VTIDVRRDDLTGAEVQSLIAEHLAGMHANTPAEHVYALAIDGLRVPSITFWSAWQAGRLCGCGALKALDDRNGEVKSMRTRAGFQRQGVGQAVLDEIIRTARSRGYERLWLETGTGPAFEPAQALYRRNGFETCGPFADYPANPFSLFMVRTV